MNHEEGNIIPCLHITDSFSISNGIQTACSTKPIWLARAKHMMRKQTKEFWGGKEHCLLRASMSFAVFDIVFLYWNCVFDIVLLYWNGAVSRISLESVGSYIVLCVWRYYKNNILEHPVLSSGEISLNT